LANVEIADRLAMTESGLSADQIGEVGQEDIDPKLLSLRAALPVGNRPIFASIVSHSPGAA
jgi:hypothetical protein